MSAAETEPTTSQEPAPPAPTTEEKRAAKMARYEQLRANVRKRRLGELVCILLAIAVFAATIVDIAAVESKLKWGLIAAYGVLLVVAILLLLSRRKRMEEEAEAAAILRDIENQLLQCPDCRNVFRYGERVFHPDDRLVFSCPYCGVFSRQPSTATRRQPVPRPIGDILQRTYVDAEGEQFVVGIFKGKAAQPPRFVDVKIRGKGELAGGDIEVVPAEAPGNAPTGA